MTCPYCLLPLGRGDETSRQQTGEPCQYQRITYVCQNCKAGLTVVMRVTQPSPFTPAELEARKNKVR